MQICSLTRLRTLSYPSAVRRHPQQGAATMFNLRRKLFATALLFAIVPVFNVAQTPKPPAATTGSSRYQHRHSRPAQGLSRHRRCLLQAHYRRPPLHRQEPARHPRHPPSSHLRQDQGQDHRQPSQEVAGQIEFSTPDPAGRQNAASLLYLQEIPYHSARSLSPKFAITTLGRVIADVPEIV